MFQTHLRKTETIIPATPHLATCPKENRQTFEKQRALLKHRRSEDASADSRRDDWWDQECVS